MAFAMPSAWDNMLVPFERSSGLLTFVHHPLRDQVDRVTELFHKSKILWEFKWMPSIIRRALNWSKTLTWETKVFPFESSSGLFTFVDHPLRDQVDRVTELFLKSMILSEVKWMQSIIRRALNWSKTLTWETKVLPFESSSGLFTFVDHPLRDQVDRVTEWFHKSKILWEFKWMRSIVRRALKWVNTVT